MAERKQRVLGAARLSRSKDESTSIERQKEQVRLTCQARDLALIHTAEDVDVSGDVSPFRREDLGPWLTDPALIARWDVIMVAKLDRLTRSLLDFADLITWCNKHGKTIISVAESIDLSTPAGRLLANILCLFAQFERERIGERRSEAWWKLAEQGKWNGGAAVSWGYRPVKAGDHWDLVPDDEPLMCLVSDRRELTGAGLARYVVDQVTGKKASVNTMAKLIGCDRKGLALRLRSRSLTGMVEAWRPAEPGEDFTRWRKEKRKDGEVVTLVPYVITGDDGMPIRREPLISDEKWAALQKVLDGRKQVHVNRSESPLLFHVAHCAACGAVLYGTQTTRPDGTEYRYYRHQVKTTRPDMCKSTGQLRMGRLDETFEAELLGRFGNRPVLAEIEHPAVDHTAELERVNAAIAEWEDRAISGTAPADSVSRILDGLYIKRDRLAALPQSEAWTEYVDTGRDLSDEWQEWSTAERNSYLRSMSVSVRVVKGAEPLFDWGKLEPGEIDWNGLRKLAQSA